MSSDTGLPESNGDKPPEGLEQAIASATLAREDREALDKSAEKRAHIRGLERFFDLRDRWSDFLTICIGGSLFFQVALTALIGLGAVDFGKYHWFLAVVVGENFLQIVGMGVIVVTFLFKDPERRD